MYASSTFPSFFHNASSDIAIGAISIWKALYMNDEMAV